jgi:hypothetical protein
LPPAFEGDTVSAMNQPSDRISGSATYVPPALRVLGSVAALTQQTQDKKLGVTDGFTFLGVPIANASP